MNYITKKEDAMRRIISFILILSSLMIGSVLSNTSVNTHKIDAGAESDTVSVPDVPVGSLPPTLALTPTSLDFGVTPVMSSILITNIGGGTLYWQASKQKSWISISPSSGSLSSGKSQTINVVVNRTDLKAGLYNDTISITSNGGNASVSVSMTVPEPDPKLSFNPSSMDFGANSNQLELTITNSGGGMLDWQLTKQQSWFTLSSTKGSLPGGNSHKITVTVIRSDQKPGIYNGTISITSNGGSGKVNVTMIIVESVPVLAFTPASLDFGTSETKKTFTITNKGSGTLNWTLSKQQSWLVLSQTTGSVVSGGSVDIAALLIERI